MTLSNPSKIFYDPIHNIIEMDSLFLRFVDTPEFQRLRQFYQLGLARFVFPGCTHSRFEHCIGTYHLAAQLVDAIQNDPYCTAVRLSEGERLSVLIAALCHDLGHGPLSHTWEHFLRRGGTEYQNYKHEEMSCLILKRIVNKDEHLRNLLREADVDLELVCALIRGSSTPEFVTKLKEKTYIFEIVSNSLNGNDVDKWDYIMRDSFHTGMGEGSSVLEISRMIRFYRPAYHAGEGTWHMSFRFSETENIFHVFYQRLRLHRTVYTHKTICALETMFIDALDALDPILHLRDTSLRAVKGDGCAMEAFLQLNEHVLWATALAQFPQVLNSQPQFEGNLQRSALLCQRIQFRKLYCLVGKFYAIRNKPISNDCNFPNIKKLPEWIRSVLELSSSNDYTAEDALNVERLGDESQILAEIFAKLPPGSPIKSVSELRLCIANHSRNSTDHAPIFYFHRTLPDGFSFTQPYKEVFCYFLMWTGPKEEEAETVNFTRGPTGAPFCLEEALNSWIREKSQ